MDNMDLLNTQLMPNEWTCKTLSPKIFTEEIIIRICSDLRELYKEMEWFDDKVQERFRMILQGTLSVDTNPAIPRKMVERYFDNELIREKFDTPERKSEVRRLMVTAFTLAQCYYPESQTLFWTNVDTLLQNYPHFREANLSQEELHYLLKFRNMMRIALEVVPAKDNKTTLMKVAAKLEGSGKEYVTGGGQKADVIRRVQIYEHEGEIRAQARPPRKLEKGEVPQSVKRRKTNFDEYILVNRSDPLFTVNSIRSAISKLNLSDACTQQSLRALQYYIDCILEWDYKTSAFSEKYDYANTKPGEVEKRVAFDQSDLLKDNTEEDLPPSIQKLPFPSSANPFGDFGKQQTSSSSEFRPSHSSNPGGLEVLLHGIVSLDSDAFRDFSPSGLRNEN